MNLVDMTWPDVAALPRDTPVVVPVAAVEQHGHHLPVVTDSLLLGEIVRRTEAALADRILVCPLQWLGNSHHHLDFPGTLSAGPRTWLDLVGDLVENWLAHGFKRIVVVNGHGGNDVPAKQALFEVRQRHRTRADLLLAFTTYWGLGTRPWEHDAAFHQREMGHACEWETSMVLRLRPDLVRPHTALAEVPFGNPFLPGFRAWITKERTAPGHIGSPGLATAEKGETLLALFAADLTTWLERVVRWDGRCWEG
jgi:creatinine amidohydrolase